MTKRVVITGTGLICPLADSRRGLHEALCDGRSGLRDSTACADIWRADESLESPQPPHTMVGPVMDFEPRRYLGDANLRPLDRTSQLLTAGVGLALADAGLTADDGYSADALRERQVGLAVGTMFCSARTIGSFDRRGLREGPKFVSPLDFANTVINAAAGQTAIWHRLPGINSTISAGLVSGLQALAYAYHAIRLGRATTLVAGGVDELCWETCVGFCRQGAACVGDSPRPVPFDVNRNGFAQAEAAALLVLEDAETAVARGATILAEVLGVGAAFDPAPFPACGCADRELAPPSPEHCRRAARAIHLALRTAQLDAHAIDAVCASANGNRVIDRRESVALSRVFQEDIARLPVMAPKAACGESLGAGGALQTITMLASMEAGRSAGIVGLEQVDPHCLLPLVTNQPRDVTVRHGLVTSYGLDGNSCAIVLGRAA